MKKEKNQKLTAYQKNEFIFESLIWDVDFYKEVNKIYDKWSLPINKYFKSIKLYIEKFNKYCKDSDKDALDFIIDVDSLMEKYNFGKHWKIFFVLYFLSGIKVFPSESFFINTNESKKNKNILIEIGYHTTLEEIENAWPKIKLLKKNIWPNEQHPRITQKTLDNYDIYIKDIMRTYERKAFGKLKAVIKNDKKTGTEKVIYKETTLSDFPKDNNGSNDYITDWFSSEFVRDLEYAEYPEDKRILTDKERVDEFWEIKEDEDDESIENIKNPSLEKEIRKKEMSLRKIRQRQRK